MRDPVPLDVDREVRDGAVVLRPQGEIDLSRSPSLRTEIFQAQRERPPRLVIDLSDVPYMDSSGVATLVEALQNSRKQGSALVLCGLGEKVRSIFEIARLDTVFRIEPDVDAALLG